MSLDWLDSELRRLTDRDLLRSRRTYRPLSAGWCNVDGRRCRNFASNDYLNLAADPRVVEAAQRALADVGAGSRASALVCGRTDWHERLERAVANFEQTESALLFPTGFSANLGTIAALVRNSDVVFCERLNHASLVDGCRLSGARLRIFRHDRLAILERELSKARDRITASRTGNEQTPRLWIVTDSVFSMDGDVAPLSELCHLAERFEAELIVDEAHATGVFGDHGRGICELSGTESRVAVRVGTLSKAVGCLGGFVAGSCSLCDWLWNSARTQMFSTALPPSICAAAEQALEIIRSEPQRREHLHALSRHLTAGLREIGLNVPDNVAGPIVPVLLGDPAAAVDAAGRLLDAGFLAGGIRPPTVPPGTSRLRLCVSAAYCEGDIDELVTAIGQCVRC
ncbi:MAG: aminotransferase class I/II-fold pyridoxal phosphate-dependent enzyme [Planctomycetota bacterium]